MPSGKGNGLRGSFALPKSVRGYSCEWAVLSNQPGGTEMEKP